ncbi:MULTISPECIES: VanZ family protein [Oceanotoga]|jgi:VanZ family protein|uniref:VanZ like protein n=1 Tax=Oceanotoga teriensis TaxID=515440 RepID=A0AA45C6C4_9BACT|nr:MULTISPECIES: VanZ family protein [Oceanotoga]MDN5343527.1 hypothetical protein [Oceanotoga sp.]MDO7977538.1 VanZ family protein [Oceanotoga teriensis]PWJ91242.1 hypothetical protein C7380_11150 [Oceanotoga teriensis]
MKIEKIIWRVIFIIYITLIFYLSLSKPIIPYSTFKYEDKIIHFIAYFISSDLFFMAFKNTKRKILFSISIILYISFPIITEYIQSLSKYHIFSYYDMIASLGGLFFGMIFFLIKNKAFK